MELTLKRIKQIELVEELTKSYYGEEAYSGETLLERMNEDYADLKINLSEWKEYNDYKLKNINYEHNLLYSSYYNTSKSYFEH
jgi:hypothetical protein